MLKSFLGRAAVIAAVVVAAGLWAGAALAITKTGGEYNTIYAGIGAKGYDPVAYHTTGKPTPGSDKITQDWKGVTWRFASEDNKKLFVANPEKYAPQFGGFCAWGVAQGRLFDVDPVNGWRIVDGKLYMNFNADILKLFNADTNNLVSKANTNWTRLNQ